MTERKFALVKVGQGDYLLPANDGRTLWRIATYMDGPSAGLEDWPRDRTFWAAWKYTGRLQWAGGLASDQVEALLDWNDWDGPWDPHLPTRKAAIKSALDSDPR